MSEARQAFEAWARSRHWTDEAIDERPMNGALQALSDIYGAGFLAAASAQSERIARLEEALREVLQATHSHVDGRDLLAELHPRRMLDIKRRRDGVETWFEGDWLSTLWEAVKSARAALESQE